MNNEVCSKGLLEGLLWTAKHQTEPRPSSLSDHHPDRSQSRLMDNLDLNLDNLGWWSARCGCLWKGAEAEADPYGRAYS